MNDQMIELGPLFVRWWQNGSKKEWMSSLHDSLFNDHILRRLVSQIRYNQIPSCFIHPFFLQVILNRFCHGHNPAGDAVQTLRQSRQQQQVCLDSIRLGS